MVYVVDEEVGVEEGLIFFDEGEDDYDCEGGY